MVDDHIERTVPLSIGQEALWFLEQVEPDRAIFCRPMAVQIRGLLDKGLLERSLNAIVRRHEILRTHFVIAQDQLLQVVRPTALLPLAERDMSALPMADRMSGALQILRESVARPFDLGAGPLVRAVLVRLGDTDHVLLLCLHQIICDHLSLRVLQQEIGQVYAALAGGTEPALPVLPCQYADRARWEHDLLQAGTWEPQIAYWKEHLGGDLPVLDLPADRVRPPVQTTGAGSCRFELPLELVAALDMLSRQEDVPLSTALLGAFMVLLFRYTGQADLLVGTVVPNRRPEEGGLIGPFANELPVRADLSDAPGFRQLLRRLHAGTMAAEAHNDVPFARVVRALQDNRTPSGDPLYRVAFRCDEEGAPQQAAGITLQWLPVAADQSFFDLTLAITTPGDKLQERTGLSAVLEYSTDLFDAPTINRMSGHYQTLLEGAAANPDLPVGNLPLLTAAEKHQLLVEWNRTEVDYPRDLSVPEVVARRAAQQPDAPAVIAGEQRLTYGELNQRANQLAHHLVGLGVGPGVRVGICLERSPELAIAQFGVLKAGGTCVAMDPTYPAERLGFMLQDAEVPVLITAARLAGSLADQAPVLLRIDADWERIAGEPATDPAPRAAAGDVAYIIYTSGSTGRPKGVEITHGGWLNFTYWYIGMFGLTPADRYTQVASPGFDATVMEIWSTLAAGASLWVTTDEVRLSPPLLRDWLVANRITVSYLPTALAEAVLALQWPEDKALRALMTGGDRLRGRPDPRLGFILVDVYGPTENTIITTAGVISPQAGPASIIGRPIANNRVYLLDQWLQPVPIGIPGELYITGDSLARGYLNRPELTASRFVANPFEPGSRMYRTGDLARYRPDGTLEFLNRIDDQVKLRGFRIELPEIEAVLRQHPGVGEAVVIIREDKPGDRRIVAYVVAEAGQSLKGSDLRRHLQGRLPHFMIPSAFVLLDALPLSPNGKVDRRGLPLPASEAIGSDVGLSTPMEEALAAIWCSVLGLERVGADANFFENGGHSLLATQVISRVRAKLEVDLPIRSVFEAPTLAQLARRIEDAGREQRAPLQPMAPVPRTEPLPLSLAQQRLWFLDQFEPGLAVYNIPELLRLTGRLEFGVLQRCLGEIVQRHEALRTTFRSAGGEPEQIIAPVSGEPFPLPLVDLTDSPVNEREGRAMQLVQAEAATPFDLARGPLFKATLYRLADDEHLLLLHMHHIVADGWSMQVLLDELTGLYADFMGGEPAGLPTLPVQYADFAVWQRQWLQGAELERQLTYWRRQLEGAPAILNMPADRLRPPVPSYRGGVTTAVLPGELLAELTDLGRREGATLFSVLLAAFNALLFRYTGQDDLVVGSPIANRNRLETEGMIGFFANTLALRTNLAGNPTFRELVHRAQETALEATMHQDLPFQVLVAALHPDRNLSYSPIFQVMFVLQNPQTGARRLPGVTVSPAYIHNGTAKFDLWLSLEEGPAGLSATLEYSADLFDAPTVSRMLGHFQTLLAGAVANPELPVDTLPLLTAAEQQQVVVEWNDTQVDYPATSVHHLVEAQAANTPGAVAVEFEGESLTYRELNERANQLAYHLRTFGVGPEMLVGIAAERSLELVVGLLGILKAGGAYVPLDPGYPRERLAFMLADSGVGVLLTQQRLVAQLPEHRATVICLDDDWGEIARHPRENPASETGPDNLAYVIYTSGSTGKPKGAMNHHRGVCNRLRWMQDEYHLNESDRVLQKTPFSFDVSVWEFFWPLMTGARLVVARPDGHKDPAYLVDLINTAAITTAHFVPPMLLVFLESVGREDCRTLRRVICSGEALPYDLQERFFRRLDAELYNLYGPTEAAVDVTHWACRRGSSSRIVPIGRPVANTRIYILDGHQQPVPTGVGGELYIGGVQVGRGYLGRPELTAERFIHDPFNAEPGARLYRTGDLSRWLPDGTIEYLGRVDHQVKIRGFRIELGEIEAALASHPEVREAVVIDREDVPGDRRLVAYVVPDGNADSRPAPSGGLVSALRRHVQEMLPAYMVPSAFVLLDAIPVTANGKVDRRALLAVAQSRSELTANYVEPRTPTEQALAQIFAAVLKMDRIGACDNFFELGGHSLLATQVISRVRASLQVDLPIRSIFEAPTLAELAQRIEDAQRTQTAPLQAITPVPRTEPLSLSLAQQRLWFLNQLEPDVAVYNIPELWRFRGRLQVDALGRCLGEIVQRHEALRTTFRGEDGEQVIAPVSSRPFPLALVDLTAGPADQREVRAAELVQAEVATLFELDRGPLFRATLYRLADEEHLLLLNVHHIVADGWSLQVLFDELTSLYAAFVRGEPSPLPALPVQYADFAVWQRQWLASGELERQLTYWRRQLEGAPAMLNMPADRPRPAVPSYRGRVAKAVLPGDLLADLKELGHREGATLFSVLFAAFNALLFRYTGQEDLVVGSPIANRNRLETEGIIGFFVNTLALRTRLAGNPTFRELVHQAQETALDATMHQDLPLQELVAALQPDRDMSYSPIFQVMFALEPPRTRAMALPDVTVSPIAIHNDTAKFDLVLAMAEGPAGLAAEFEYSTDLFDAPTVTRMLGHFQTLLEAAAADPDLPVGALPLLTAAERQQLLVEWNHTEADYSREVCVPELVARQAREQPDAPAVIAGEQRLTYGELNQRANQLARHLAALGVGPGARVGVCLDRSPELIIGLLGVLKVGGAYVAMDPTYPAERLGFMLQDAGVSVLITAVRLAEGLAGYGAALLRIDADWERIAAEPAAEMTPCASAGDVAYVIYTSGSTGRPKGVEIEHGGLLNLVYWHTRTYGLTPADRTTQVASPGFDASVWEIWPSLAAGTALWIPTEEERLSPSLLRDWLVTNRINVSFLPTPLAEGVLALDWPRDTALRALLTGGDRLRRRPDFRTGFAVVNHYGPTENTVVATAGVVSPNGATAIPDIGRPIANVRVYLLDRWLQPVPVGIPGELCIAGDGVARGYLNRPELTAERFTADPFAPGSRMYRTGDLARYRSDGTIEFLNRIDDQVKLRGFRIELSEIETILRAYPGVHETVVIVREDEPGDRHIVAYVVAEADNSVTVAALRRHLQDHLPQYMIPSAFILLDALPVSANGKVNRSALPAPASEATGARRGLSTPIEEALAAIWCAVLGHDGIDADANFFEIGGHSLLATRLISRVRESFSVDLPLRSVFEAPTLAQLAQRVANAQRQQLAPLPPIGVAPQSDSLPLSFAQQQLWFLDQLDPGSAGYNVPMALRLLGTLNKGALADSFDYLVRRHESLRTVFEPIGGEAVQRVMPPRPVPVVVTDLTELGPDERTTRIAAAFEAEAHKPFDLIRGPLFRVHLLWAGAEDHVLIVGMHHIITDGWSQNVFLKELAEVYAAFDAGRTPDLPELPIRYSDFAVWQRRWLQAEVLEQHLAHWRQQLGSNPAPLALPIDRPRPPVQTTHGALISRRLPNGLPDRLRRLGRDEGATLFMTMLAAFQAWLSYASGQTQVIVGTPLANRTHGETEGLIGFFVNTLPMCANLSDNPTFRAVLQQVRKGALEAYTYQELPFELVVNQMQFQRDPSRTPVFQVMFDYAKQLFAALDLPGLSMQVMDLPVDVAKVDLTLGVHEAGYDLSLLLEYNTDLFDAATAERMLDEIQTTLEAAAKDPDAHLQVLFRRLTQVKLAADELDSILAQD